MKNLQKITSFLMMIVVLLLATTNALAQPSTNYTLAGNEADNIIAVATAQKGKTLKDFTKLRDPWCGQFVGWCAETSGSTHVSKGITGAFTAIEYEVNNGLGEFYCFSDVKTHETNKYYSRSFYNYLKIYNDEDGHRISEYGLTHVHEVTRGDFTPKKGDIIIFLWSSDRTDPQGSHVGFVRENYDGKGYIKTVEGNSGGKVALNSYRYTYSCIVGYVRPNYSNATSGSTTSNTSAVQTKPVTLSSSVSSISLDMSSKTSQTITLQLGGDAEGSSLFSTSSAPGVANSGWGSYKSGFTVPVIITAKSPGTSTVTYTAKDGAGSVLATASVKVTVTSPTYTVQYDANGGSNAPASQTKTYQKGLTLSSAQPTRAGYTFSGWATSSSGSVQYRPGEQYTKDQNVTLYAVWTQESTVRPATLSAIYSNITLDLADKNSQTITLMITGDTPELCQLYSSVGDTSVASSNWSGDYKSGDNVNVTITAKKAGTTTITYSLVDETAKKTIATKEIKVTVTAPSYTVQYNANGGTNIPAAQTKIYQEPLTISDTQPIRSGYEFKGWATSPNGSAQYQPGGTYSIDQNVTLYAVWESTNNVSLTLEQDFFIAKFGEDVIVNFSFTGTIDDVKCTRSYSDTAFRSNCQWSQNSYNGTMRINVSSAGTTVLLINLYDSNGQVLASRPVTIIVNNAPVYMEELRASQQEKYTGNMGDSFIDVIGTRNGNIDVCGNSYEHGLTAWVARWNYTPERSWVWNQYDLKGDYTSLTGKVVLLRSYNENNFDTQLKIYGDGRVLLDKRLTPSTLPTADFQVDISNVTTLKIEFSDNIAVAGGTAFGLANLMLK